MTTTGPRYQHIQRSPLCVIIYLAGWIAGLTVILVYSQHETDLAILVGLLPVAVLFAIAPAFHYLRISDDGERLRVGFGPLPLFKTQIAYREITAIEVDRTTLFDGWGIHMSPRGGWVWNIWGRDCVKITRSSGVIRIGTNEPAQLAEFLKARCPQLANSQSA